MRDMEHAFTETPLFYGFLFAHLVFLVVGLGAVLVIDVIGFLWMRGRVEVGLLQRAADITQRAIWIGWSGMVASGTGLIVIKGFVDSLTAIKIFLVAMIGINGVVLHFVKHAVGRAPTFRELPPVYRYYVFATTLVSQVGWWGAFIIGFMHRHIRHYWEWPASPWPTILVVSGVWLALMAVGRVWLMRSRGR